MVNASNLWLHDPCVFCGGLETAFDLENDTGWKAERMRNKSHMQARNERIGKAPGSLKGQVSVSASV